MNLRTRYSLALGVVLVASCAGVLRKNFTEDPTGDAARLTIRPAPNQTNYIDAFEDPDACKGAMDLGGETEFEAERTVRVAPGKLFGFNVSLVQVGAQYPDYVASARKSCRIAAFFTPEPRAAYRAWMYGSALQCRLKVVKVVDGKEVQVPGLRLRATEVGMGLHCVD
ncbi:MAG: hypothetical protein U0229_20730 [Anaeromyxobacter sp.]